PCRANLLQQAYIERQFVTVPFQHKHLAQLRSEPNYLMAEFLYSMKVFGISTAEDIERFADLHNEYVVSLTSDPAKLQR
ncbi:hypothetical protein ACC758_39585, partial [Rhizobium ruizarguesonis]